MKKTLVLVGIVAALGLLNTWAATPATPDNAASTNKTTATCPKEMNCPKGAECPKGVDCPKGTECPKGTTCSKAGKGGDKAMTCPVTGKTGKTSKTTGAPEKPTDKDVQ